MKNIFIIKNFFETHFLIILIFTYLTIRLINLTLLPIFNDEAIYLDWGYRAINIKGYLSYPIMHAKPPLLVWIFGLMQKIISDPLQAGRIISVFAGLLTTLGIYKISQTIFGRKVAIIATTIYLINPLFIFYDRQALMESSISAAGVWSFHFFHRLLSEHKVKYSILLGISLGIGYFIKSNSFAFIISVFILGIYYIFRSENIKSKQLINNLFIVLIIFLIVISPLILNQYFWTTLSQNNNYILMPKELIKFPITTWLKNFWITLSISLVYLNPLILLSAIVGIFFLVKERRNGLFLVWCLNGIAVSVLLVKLMSVRYIVSFLPLTTVLAAYALDKIHEKLKLSAVILLSIIPSVILSYFLIFHPLTYFELLDKITIHSQKEEYMTNWTSGYGFEETKGYLENSAKNKMIIVGVRVDEGIPENAVFAYFLNSTNIKPVVFDSLILDNKIFEYDCLKTSIPFYFVSRDGNLTGLNKFFQEEKRFYKPEEKNYIGIHSLKDNCQGKTLELN
ncbi:hypothetical protein A2955_04945 [Candidatus Woesebacteria bacterium RIFCSPLOWO2_01_FULL_37_19]|uniref:Glycosyltransferase RgtA/B/C/D-like domain-containing protein n=2 Tax=Candidatus Woeseibacteriota TaxID=1752722 RepID=A0A1F8BBE9_9BACT|nr:MAG: hypothetical protein A2771_02990 [Candidatus Woesebacteria bacterium RIFCSPHIGHO2_01_FULL_38_26b]OGM61362.1 MAG: hypothetical protein A2955_04945 [Candidatus Woesebacteria bacterium RIFCSPLOWO2_01_FULL_37_19]